MRTSPSVSKPVVSSPSVPTAARSSLPRTTSQTSSPASPASVKRSPSAPSSPSRVRSLNDILSDHHKLVRAYDSDKEQIRLRSNSKVDKATSKSSESLPVPSQSEATIIPPTNILSEKATPSNLANGKPMQKKL